jgi:hypothetical protein
MYTGRIDGVRVWEVYQTGGQWKMNRNHVVAGFFATKQAAIERAEAISKELNQTIVWSVEKEYDCD